MASNGDNLEDEDTRAWQHRCTQFVDRCARVLESQHRGDCAFLVGKTNKTRVMAHKIIVSMASPVFAAMLSDAGANQTDTFPVPDMELESFQDMLVYLYTDRVQISSYESARGQLYGAQMYALPQLYAECIAHLAANLAPSNVCQTLELVQLVGDNELLERPLIDKCHEMMRNCTMDILSHSRFSTIRLRTVETLFAQEPLQIDSEWELFKAAERYANERKLRDEEAKTSLRGVLQQIRFLTLDARHFAECDTSFLLSEAEVMAISMNIISLNSRLPMPSGFSESRTPRNKSTFDLEDDKENRTEITFQFVVNNFANLKKFNATFNLRGLPWRVVIYGQTFMFVRIDCNGEDKRTWSCEAEVEIRVLPNKSPGEPQCQKFKHEFRNGMPSSWWNLCPWEELLDPARGCLQNGAATVELHIKV